MSIVSDLPLGIDRPHRRQRHWAYDWTAERCALLRDLWAQQHLTARAIGKVLGCNRDAVIGKAHRMKLPSKRG